MIIPTGVLKKDIKAWTVLLMVGLMGLWVKPTVSGIKPSSGAKWGARVNKAGRVGKFGEISLNS